MLALVMSSFLFAPAPDDGGQVIFVWSFNGNPVIYGRAWYWPRERVYVLPCGDDFRSAWVGQIRDGLVVETHWSLRYDGLSDVWRQEATVTRYDRMRSVRVGKVLYVFRGG